MAKSSPKSLQARLNNSLAKLVEMKFKHSKLESELLDSCIRYCGIPSRLFITDEFPSGIEFLSASVDKIDSRKIVLYGRAIGVNEPIIVDGYYRQVVGVRRGENPNA